MKQLCMLLALALLLGCLAGCGSAPAEDVPEKTEAPSGETEAPADETDAPAIETDGPEDDPTAPTLAEDALPDFAVTTISGDTYHLYDEVKTHELVLINLFATWCGPCKMEFPYLEEAWEQEQDRVSVIALSIEPTDTLDVLRDFANEYGLQFPVAREDGTDLGRFVTEGIPTTLVVDRTGRVAAVEVGAKSSTQDFLDLFDNYSGADYDPNLCIYTVYVYGSTGLVGGAVVNFCTDTTCTPVVSTDDGPVYFTGAPAVYHVQVVQVPEGWELAGDADFYTEAYGQTFYIPLLAVG